MATEAFERKRGLSLAAVAGLRARRLGRIQNSPGPWVQSLGSGRLFERGGEYNGQRELNGWVEHKSAEFIKSVVLWREGTERVPAYPTFPPFCDRGVPTFGQVS